MSQYNGEFRHSDAPRNVLRRVLTVLHIDEIILRGPPEQRPTDAGLREIEMNHPSPIKQSSSAASLSNCGSCPH